MTALTWVASIWIGLILSAISGLGIRACLFLELDVAKAPWQVRWTYRLGQGLVVWTALAVIVGLIMVTKHWIQSFC